MTDTCPSRAARPQSGENGHSVTGAFPRASRSEEAVYIFVHFEGTVNSPHRGVLHAFDGASNFCGPGQDHGQCLGFFATCNHQRDRASNSQNSDVFLLLWLNCPIGFLFSFILLILLFYLCNQTEGNGLSACTQESLSVTGHCMRVVQGRSNPRQMKGTPDSKNTVSF